MDESGSEVPGVGALGAVGGLKGVALGRKAAPPVPRAGPGAPCGRLPGSHRQHLQRVAAESNPERLRSQSAKSLEAPCGCRGRSRVSRVRREMLSPALWGG